MTNKTRNNTATTPNILVEKPFVDPKNPDASAAEVAKELSIHPGQIYNWRRQYKRLSDKQSSSLNGVDYSIEESEEIRKLKRQVSELKEEIEFFKKRRCTYPKTGSEVHLHRYLSCAACGIFVSECLLLARD